MVGGLSREAEIKMSRFTNRGVSWPAWTPRDLIVAHDTILKMPDSAWLPVELDQYVSRRMSGQLQPSDYIVGVGDRLVAGKIIERLGKAASMRSVWQKINKLESRILPAANGETYRRLKKPRNGKDLVFLTQNESVCCLILHACVAALNKASQPKSTRAQWKMQHQQAARLALSLVSSLSALEANDESLLDPRLLFTDETMRILSGELYAHARSMFTQPDDQGPVDDSPQTEEEIKADTEQWDTEVDDFQYWVEDAFQRGCPRIDAMLQQLSTLLNVVAANPPYSPPAQELKVALLAEYLCALFSRLFRQPLYDVVSVI